MNRKAFVIRSMGMAAVGLLITLALAIPKVVNGIYDGRTLHHIEYQENTLDTYEVAYKSFAEKLYAMALSYGRGTQLQSVSMPELGNGLSDEELTDVVPQELDSMYESNVLEKELSVAAKHMNLREMYTMYAMDGKMHGIRYWKVCYEEEDYDVTIYLDTEFYKVYFIEVVNKNDFISESLAVSGKKIDDGGGVIDFFGQSDSMFLEKGYEWVSYWNLWDYEDGVKDVVMIAYNMAAVYMDEYNCICLSEEFVIQEDKYGCIRRGIYGFTDMTQL